MTEFKPPCWLYHSKHEAGIFNTQAELDEALADGWRDSPAAAAALGEALPVIEAAMPDDGVAEALELAEDAIEQAQKVIRKRRKR